ncbi:hypothetical protein T08_1893 [Trichinella sp. T8]|nr:hypothetical protein T08_1893 [Trichinella sp. T8]
MEMNTRKLNCQAQSAGFSIMLDITSLLPAL